MRTLRMKILVMVALTLVGIPVSYWLQPIRAPYLPVVALFLLLNVLAIAVPVGRFGPRRVRLGSVAAMYPSLLYGAWLGAALALLGSAIATRLSHRSQHEPIAYGSAVSLATLVSASLFHLFGRASLFWLLFALLVFLALRTTLLWWVKNESDTRFGSVVRAEGMVEAVTLPTQLTVLILQREQEWWLVLLVCSAVALGIIATRALIRAYEAQRQVRALRVLNRRLVAHIHPDHLLIDLAVELQRLLFFNRLSLWSYAREEADLQIVSVYPAKQRADLPPYLPAEGMVAKALDASIPTLLSDRIRSRLPILAESFQGHLLIIPLKVHRYPWGLLVFERWRHYEPFVKSDYHCLRVVTDHLATILENMRLYRQTAQQAKHDGLTGLLNRHHLDERLHQEVARASRYHRPLSVLMIDVDYFKAYNDTYGHLQGDELLRSLSSLLQQNLRQSDVIGRYGGEEFLVLLPETDKASASQLARRLCHLVANTAFLLGRNDMPTYCTVSIGVASLPEDALTVSELVNAADQALYEAKRRGRNQVREA